VGPVSAVLALNVGLRPPSLVGDNRAAVLDPVGRSTTTVSGTPSAAMPIRRAATPRHAPSRLRYTPRSV
jgi:hypothetical protein